MNLRCKLSKYSERWVKTITITLIQTKDICENATNIFNRIIKNKPRKMGIDDFEIIRYIGIGGFSTVVEGNNQSHPPSR